MTTAILYPISDSSSAGILNSADASSPLYSEVDEVTLNTADYIKQSGDGAGNYAYFGWTQLPAGDMTISEIIFYGNVGISGTQTGNFKCPNSSYTGNSLANGDNNQHYSTNPATSAAWTKAQVNAMTSGFVLNGSGKGPIYLYQTKIEVVYTIASGGISTSNFFQLF